MTTLRTAAQQALDSINELFAAEQSEGGERGGHIRTPATREHLVRVAQARKALHESCGALRAALAQQAEPVQAISECIAVLRPMVKGKFPHEQALDELVGYTASPQRTMVPLTEKEMYAVDEEARKNFRLSQKGPRGQQITYWDGLTPWLIRAVERAHGIKE